jgi:hypothetical protein
MAWWEIMNPMSGDKVPANEAVCLAVCVGWRLAELYDSKELPEPPHRRNAGRLPGHLPGFGEMTGYEKACALAAHLGADLASLRRALGLEDLPSVEPVVDALREPGHSHDEVREVILDLYLTVRDLVAGSSVSAALGVGLGRLLADTALLPSTGHPEVLAERFNQYRIANALGWLEDLETRLPQHSAAVVRATLTEWQQWVGGLPRSPQGALDPAAIDAALIRALRQQGNIWRRLLTGEQRPDQLLDRQAYIGAATKLLGTAWRIGIHYAWRWSWSIVLAGSAVAAIAWVALTYAPGGTSRAAAAVVSAAGFLGVSWLSVRATLGRALRQAESALWEAEVTAAIARAATTTPKSRPRRATPA